jgi:hypothetical protein
LRGDKGVASQTSKKPTYYLWKTKDTNEEELENQKKYWSSLGFRVVIFIDGDCEKDINEGIKAVIHNHILS